jgi:uncharacterized repeat protein (TIGR02543 family)
MNAKYIVARLKHGKPRQRAFVVLAFALVSAFLAPLPAFATNYTLTCSKTSNATANSVATSVSNTAYSLTFSGSQLVKGSAYACAGVATIPNGVTSIEFGAFVPWSLSNSPLTNPYLTSIVWPTSSLTAINYGLIGLNGLNSLTIPSSVTSISSQAIQGTTALTAATVEGPSSSANTLTLPSYMFNEDVLALTIGNGYVNIGPYFDNGAVFTAVNLGPNVRVIGQNAFQGQTDNRAFTSIAFPSGLTTIGDGAFANNPHLGTISFGTGTPGLTSIAANAFSTTGGSNPTVVGSVRYCGLINPTFDNAVLDSYLFANLPNASIYCNQSTPAPTVASVTPSTGLSAGGSIVTVSGSNLSGAKVFLNGVSLPVSANTASSLQVTMPAGAAGSTNLMVLTDGGSVTMSFTYVNRLTNPITVTSSPATTNYIGGSYTPTATALGGVVSISVDASSSTVCSLDGAGVVQFATAGACKVNFNQAGDSTYAAATQVQQVITVNAFTITTKNVAITVPLTNGTPQTSVADNGQFSAAITWSGSPSTFGSNTTYTATVTITPDSTYTLTGVAATYFTINGNAPTTGNSAGGGVFTYTFPATAKATISTRNVLITAPVLNATPQTSTSDNGQFTTSISWSGTPSAFAANSIYTATVTVTPDSTYSLTGVAANFFTVNGNAATVGNLTNGGTFSYTFPAYWQVSFVPNGGTGSQSSQYYQTGGSAVVLPSTTTFTAPTGKVFGGWATSSTSTIPVTASYQTASAVSYFAIWTQTNHTVSFDINGGNGSQSMADQTLRAPSSLTANAFTFTGHYFLNWNTAADGTGTQYVDQSTYQFLANVRLYAQWGYVVTYTTVGADSGSPSRLSDNWISGAIALPTKGTMLKAGYDFAGWRAGSSNYTTTYTPTTIFTLNPVWVAHTYSISYSKTGAASGTVPAGQTWTSGTSPLTLSGNSGSPALALVGYTFGGWASVADPATRVITYSTFSDQVFVPIWVPVEYSVTFSLNGGDGAAPTQASLNINQSYTLPLVRRVGFAFLGWQLDGTANKYSAGVSVAVTTTTATAVSYTAQWVAQYTVSYAMNGSTTIENSPSNVGLFNESTVISLPAAPDSISGYTFVGWKDSNGVVHPAGASFTVIQDSVLGAQWAAIPYTVSYSLGVVSGAAPTSTTANFNTSFSVAPAPSKPGFEFVNWNTAADGTGASYVGGQSYALVTPGNVTLTAQWSQISYTVTFDLGGGSGTTPSSLTNKHIGDSFALPASSSNPTWKAHTFSSWTDGLNTYAPGATFTMGASSVTLTAVFQLNGTTAITYSFGSNPGSGTLPSQAASMEGSRVTLKSGAGLSRSGYTFAGWTDGVNVFQVGDSYAVPIYSSPVTFSPVWISGSSLAYSAGDGSGPVPTDSAIRYRGDSFSVAAPASTLLKDGFTFFGWNDGVATYKPGSTYTVGNDSIMLTAVWIQSSLFAAFGTPMTELSHKTLHSGVGYPIESFQVGSSTVSYTIPADAFGLKSDNMDLHVYALADASTLASILPSNQNYILPTIITWLAADGTVPSAVAPLTQTITSSQIHVGTTAYAVTGTTYTILGVADIEGSITISISDDPLIVLGNPVPVVSSVTSGGSGNETVRVPESPIVVPETPVTEPVKTPVSNITIVKLPVLDSSTLQIEKIRVSPKTSTVQAHLNRNTVITLIGLAKNISVKVLLRGSLGQLLNFPNIKRSSSQLVLPGVKFLAPGTSRLTVQLGKAKRVLAIVTK